MEAKEKTQVTFESYRDFKSYVINLDREQHRYEETRRRLTQAGFTNVHRWEATDYKKEDVNAEMRRMGVGHLERFCNDAELAVALSHLKVLANFLSGREEYCLIFEDDVIAHPNFRNLASFEDIQYGEFDMLAFGGVFVGHDKITLECKNLQELKSRQNKSSHVDDAVFWQAHAYMVTREFAYKAISNYSAWTNTEEYHHPQWDEYFSRAPWFRTKLIADQTSTENHKYRLHTIHPTKICGILFQDASNTSTIQNY
jgi:GR25 family glycosyltransferase involved in LPS biosynthesis